MGFALPVADRPNMFVAGLKKRIVLVTWDGQSETPEIVENLLEVQKDVKNELLRINDGKADPSGRVWAGESGVQAPGPGTSGRPRSVTRVTFKDAELSV